MNSLSAGRALQPARGPAQPAASSCSAASCSASPSSSALLLASARSGLAPHGSRHRSSHVVRCFQGDAGSQPGHKSLKLNLQVPYRVHFGQSVAVVGSGESLGNWDPTKSVLMKWTDGDWWTAEVTVPTGNSTSLDVEYKYVVVNADGRVGLWKPGSNYKVTMPLAGANGASKVLRRIKVADAWDDSFKKVDVEEAEGAPAQQPATSARASASAPAKPAQQQPTRPPAPPAAPVPPVAPSYRASSAPAATSYAANGAPKGAPVPPAPPPVPPTPPTPPQPPAKAVPPPQPVYMQLTEQELLSDGVRNSLEELRVQMEKHQQLREQTQDQLGQMKDMLEALTKEVGSQREQLAALGDMVSRTTGWLSAAMGQPPQPQAATTTHQLWFGASQTYGALGPGYGSMPMPMPMPVWQQPRPVMDVQPQPTASAQPMSMMATTSSAGGRAATVVAAAAAAGHDADHASAGGVHGSTLRTIIQRSASPSRRYVVRSARAAASSSGRVLTMSPRTAWSKADVTLPAAGSGGKDEPAAAAVGLVAAAAVDVPPAVAQPASAASPSVVVPVICGVSKSSLTGARGLFNIQHYRAAAAGSGGGGSPRGKPAAAVPACVELQGLKRNGTWAVVAPSQQLTPLEFVVAAGLKGKNWKASIRLFANDVVGQPLAVLLDNLVERGPGQ